MTTHLLTVRKVQPKTFSNIYQSSDCSGNFFYCNPTRECNTTNGISDFVVDKIQCPGCPDQFLCMKPERSQCSIGLSSNGWDPLVSYGWDDDAPNLKCVFDISKIDNVDQITKFDEKFSSKNILTVNSLFCENKVRTCPSKLGTECSRLRSLDLDGDFCRAWVASLPKSEVDFVYENYCLKHNTPDCRCIRRFEDPTYLKTKGLLPFSDNCWYVPCADAESIYLVPHHLEENPNCPKDICQQIINVSNARDVDIQDLNTFISCDFDGNQSNGITKSSVWFLLRTFWIIPFIICLIILFRILP